MKQKKFLSYFISITAIMMLFCMIYIFTINKTHEVKNYELSGDYRYSGHMKSNKFNGTGVLESPRGNFKGEFVDGRFDGKVLFIGDDYAYLASFNKKSTNKDVIIKLSNGDIYKKIGGKWEMISDED